MYQPTTNQVLSSSICSYTEFHLLIFDSVQVTTCLVKSVLFTRHGWQKPTDSCSKILFQNRFIYDRTNPVHMPMELMLNKKKITHLPHVYLIFFF